MLSQIPFRWPLKDLFQHMGFFGFKLEWSIKFEKIFILDTVIGMQGLSLDSTHTEPCAHRLSDLGNTLSLSSLPQHFSTT